MCPACALTCQCAKCSRRLLTLAAKYAGVPVPAAARVPARGGGGEVGANYASTRGGLSRAAKSAALQRGYANSDWSIEASMGDAHDGRRGASAHERALDALLLRAVDELRTADGRQRMPARAISQARHRRQGRVGGPRAGAWLF